MWLNHISMVGWLNHLVTIGLLSSRSSTLTILSVYQTPCRVTVLHYWRSSFPIGCLHGSMVWCVVLGWTFWKPPSIGSYLVQITWLLQMDYSWPDTCGSCMRGEYRIQHRGLNSWNGLQSGSPYRGMMCLGYCQGPYYQGFSKFCCKVSVVCGADQVTAQRKWQHPPTFTYLSSSVFDGQVLNKYGIGLYMIKFASPSHAWFMHSTKGPVSLLLIL